MRAIFVLVAYAVVLIMAASVLDGCPASDKSDVPPDVNILDVIPDSTSDGDATSFEDAKAYGLIDAIIEPNEADMAQTAEAAG